MSVAEPSSHDNRLSFLQHHLKHNQFKDKLFEEIDEKVEDFLAMFANVSIKFITIWLTKELQIILSCYMLRYWIGNKLHLDTLLNCQQIHSCSINYYLATKFHLFPKQLQFSSCSMTDLVWIQSCSMTGLATGSILFHDCLGKNVILFHGCCKKLNSFPMTDLLTNFKMFQVHAVLSCRLTLPHQENEWWTEWRKSCHEYVPSSCHDNGTMIGLVHPNSYHVEAVIALTKIWTWCPRSHNNGSSYNNAFFTRIHLRSSV